MILLLYGADRHSLLQKKKEICDIYAARNPALDMKRFDLQIKDQMADLDAFFKTPSLFVTKKLAVVDSPFARAKELLLFLQSNEAAHDEDRTILIIYDKELPKGDLASYLISDKQIRTQRFPLTTSVGAGKLIRETCRAAGIAIERDGVATLVSYYGVDTGALRHAVERLILWKQANQSTTVSDIDLLYFSPQGEESIFVYVEALLKNDVPGAMVLLHRSSEPFPARDVIRIFELQLKQLMVAMSNDKKAQSAIPGWLVRKLHAIARATNENTLLHWYTTIASLDVRLKQGAIGEEEAQEELLYASFV
ncbi:MAG: hypothetical protein KGI50_04430 [Patescibacteria group bacterium]|nr:hypothetical protein [Patescibacteria group bacterium]MDE2438466.1 hypothetical protein [Patescibacteria group bacterium]